MGSILKSAIALIQARVDSSRLPGKVLLELAGKPMLEHIAERALAIKGIDKVIIATGNGKANLPLEKIAKETGIEFFQGSEDNVLERFYLASEKYPSDYIVRITADNPFTDPEYASMALEIAFESGVDLCSIANLPLGTAVEIISKEALDTAYSQSSEKYQKEHVTPYIKEHSELYKVERYNVRFENPFEDLRLTVDTAEDFEFAEKIYDGLYQGEIFSVKSVIEFLKDNKSLPEINKNIRQRTMFHSSDEK